MVHINIEIKAKITNPEQIRTILKVKNADFKGEDHQIDTYFKVSKGKLKLREGKIENDLIYYQREEETGPKQSNVIFFSFDPKSSLKDVLTKSLGVLGVVTKKREIYFIDNIKFHIDKIKELGTFLEIEARDEKGNIGKEKLIEQCNFFKNLFKISEKDLISVSYLDLLKLN
ncbi:MAG: class IV adenylate cyclase [archaeon]|nr:MAG: class IV adenylate cyclase [archaeon]